jgi:hypothetical protein
VRTARGQVVEPSSSDDVPPDELFDAEPLLARTRSRTPSELAAGKTWTTTASPTRRSEAEASWSLRTICVSEVIVYVAVPLLVLTPSFEPETAVTVP